MRFFSRVFAAAILAAVVSANPAPGVGERQLSSLPISVCATDNFSGDLPLLTSLVESLGSELLDCPTGETCAPLDITLAGSLLPLGTCDQST